MKNYLFIFLFLAWGVQQSAAQQQPLYPVFNGNLLEHLNSQVMSLVRGQIYNPGDAAIVTNIQFRIGARGDVISWQFVPAVDSAASGLLSRLLQTTSFHWTPQTLHGKVQDSSIVLVLPVQLRFPPGPTQAKTAKEILDAIPSVSTDQSSGLNPAVKKEVTMFQPTLCVLLPLFAYRFMY